MTLLDRWVALRFLANFALLFLIMYLFAASIDVILELERYVDAARVAVESGRFSSMLLALPLAIIDFNAPRIFQFYAYMVGLISVAAAGFTLAQFVRNRELVAIMSAGVSLHRVALAILTAAVGLNIIQFVNQEVMLPRLAPRLVREHDAIFSDGVARFAVPLIEDEAHSLVLAGSFEPQSETARNLLVIERDEEGRAKRRVVAPEATWNDERKGWDLLGGTASGREIPDVRATRETRIDKSEPCDFVATDVSPREIMSRHFRSYAQLLSIQQITQLAAEGGMEPSVASRLTGMRFAGASVNLLMLAICLPFFLLRVPQALLQSSVICAGTAVPAMLTSFFFMMVPLPGIPPMLGVFLPVAVLLPFAAARLGALRT